MSGDGPSRHFAPPHDFGRKRGVARVARALLQFARHLGEDTGSGRVRIRYRVTQSDLAAMAGVARESVSRTLSEWRRRKVLEESSRIGFIVHRARLENEAAE